MSVSAAYQALWDEPALQARMADGIARHRQGDARVRVVDGAGRPVAGAKLAVEQRDSAFHFGANIFMLGGYPTAALNQRYEQAFGALFNSATVPLYWAGLELEPGRPRFAANSVPQARRPPPDVVVAYCEAQGLRMNGHCLVWDNRRWSIPSWLEDAVDCAPLLDTRIRQIGERYGTRIRRWDVLNEAAGPRHAKLRPMPANFERLAFTLAERYLPKSAHLMINDTTGASWTAKDLPHYQALIRRLFAEGARIDGIGMQFHLFADAELERVVAGALFPPEQLLSALDRLAEFQRPIHISEITLTSPGSTPAGLEAQATVARNFYRLWFSHAAVDGITWWNVPDGGAAPGEDTVASGLLDRELRPKPSYEALRDLIHREWRTRLTGTTAADGGFRFRGFHGTYAVTLPQGTKAAHTFTLAPRTPTPEWTITLPAGSRA